MNTLIINDMGNNTVKQKLNECNGSYVIMDHDGSLYNELGRDFEAKGYTVKCLNLRDPENSETYNPLEYVKDEYNLDELLTHLFIYTNPVSQSNNDPFWEKSEKALLSAVIAYKLFEEKQPCTFEMIGKMLIKGKAELDAIFSEIKEDSYASKQYRTFDMGAGKICDSIIMSSIVRIGMLCMKNVVDMTSTNSISFDKMRTTNTAIFIIEAETPLDFLSSLFVAQAYDRIDRDLPALFNLQSSYIKVTFIINEGCKGDHRKILIAGRFYGSTMTYSVPVISTLKAVYEDKWEDIVNRFDEIVYYHVVDSETNDWFIEKVKKVTKEELASMSPTDCIIYKNGKVMIIR